MIETEYKPIKEVCSTLGIPNAKALQFRIKRWREKNPSLPLRTLSGLIHLGDLRNLMDAAAKCGRAKKGSK